MVCRRFKQVDVFTSEPYCGNPVAVILEAEGLTSEAMQRIAAWTNLSETTFVLPPTCSDADYRLRIFTPKGELPFAGHPTIGSAHAILESGLVRPETSVMVQECGSGLLPLTIENTPERRHLFVKAPSAKIEPVKESWIMEIESVLDAGIDKRTPPCLIDVGPVWLVVMLEDPQAIHRQKPDMAAMARLSTTLNMVGITVFTLTGQEACPVYTRSFAPVINVPEDPVCGSGNAAVAAFLVHHRLLERTGHHYTANQGQEIGRNGFVSVRVDQTDFSIEIGGPSVTCVDGVLQSVS